MVIDQTAAGAAGGEGGMSAEWVQQTAREELMRRSELAQLMYERDEARVLADDVVAMRAADMRVLHNAVTVFDRVLAEQVDHASGLKAAIIRYCDHLRGCPKRDAPIAGILLPSCSCGFDAMIERIFEGSP